MPRIVATKDPSRFKKVPTRRVTTRTPTGKLAPRRPAANPPSSRVSKRTAKPVRRLGRGRPQGTASTIVPRRGARVRGN